MLDYDAEHRKLNVRKEEIEARIKVIDEEYTGYKDTQHLWKERQGLIKEWEYIKWVIENS